MILYAIVCFFSVAGVALNIIPIFNLRSIEDPKLTDEIVKGMTTGFYIIAFIYLVIALTSMGVIIKKRFSKTLLLILAMLLISTFVFGPFIFDFILGDTSLAMNVKK